MPSNFESIEEAIDESPKSVKTPAISNVTITSANTEYSLTLLPETKRFTVKLRDGASFRLAFVSGKVATPTEPYLTINDGFGYTEDNVKYGNITLYMASPVATKVAEIVTWI